MLPRREEILKIYESIAARGSPPTLPHRRLQYETYDGFEEDVKRFCNDFEHRVDEYETLLTEIASGLGAPRASG